MSIGETENPEISRMTIVTEGDDKIIEQVVKQLNRLIDTIKIVDLTETAESSKRICPNHGFLSERKPRRNYRYMRNLPREYC